MGLGLFLAILDALGSTPASHFAAADGCAYSFDDARVHPLVRRILQAPGWEQLLWDQLVPARIDAHIRHGRGLLFRQVGLVDERHKWDGFARTIFPFRRTTSRRPMLHTVAPGSFAPLTDALLLAEAASRCHRAGSSPCLLDLRLVTVLRGSREGGTRVSERAWRAFAAELRDEIEHSGAVEAIVISGMDHLWPEGSAEPTWLVSKLLWPLVELLERQGCTTLLMAAPEALDYSLELEAEVSRRDIGIGRMKVLSIKGGNRGDWLRPYLSWKLRGFESGHDDVVDAVEEAIRAEPLGGQGGEVLEEVTNLLVDELCFYFSEL